MIEIEKIGRKGRTQTLPAVKQGRPETGTMSFGEDWPGVFIRGDNAFFFGTLLRQMLDGSISKINEAPLSQLAELLLSSYVHVAESDPPSVMIGGVTYVPKADIPPIDDKRLKAALMELTSQLYLHEPNPRCWDAINALAPELAQLVSQDPKAAFDRVRESEDDD